MRSERGAMTVSASAAARQIGLREGDVILWINGYDVDDAEQAADLLRRAARRGYVRMVYERQGQRGEISFRITG